MIAFVRTHPNLVSLWHQGRLFRAIGTGDRKLAAPINVIRGISARKLASHAGVFRGARISSLPTKGRNTSSPKSACVGRYPETGLLSTRFRFCKWHIMLKRHVLEIHQHLTTEYFRRIKVSLSQVFFQQLWLNIVLTTNRLAQYRSTYLYYLRPAVDSCPTGLLSLSVRYN